MNHDDLCQDTFIHALRRISDLSEAAAEKAWYSIHSPVGLAPEKQATLYAGLYGLTKTKK
jgi:hypothetical protein